METQPWQVVKDDPIHNYWSRLVDHTKDLTNYIIICYPGSNEVRALYSSIEMFHQHTCLRFVPKSYYNRDYLKIVSQGG